MTKNITIGIDLNYDRISACYMDKVTHNMIKPMMKEFFLPTISMKDEIKQNEPRHKTGFKIDYLKNMINNSSEMKETKLKLYNEEFSLIDEISLQTFFKYYVEESTKIGKPYQVVIGVSNSADYLAMKRITESAKMAGLEFVENNEENGNNENKVDIQVIPSAITPFVTMQNFDHSYEKYVNKITQYVFVDVNSTEIHFIYGICDRRENQRKVVVEKIHKVNIGFDKFLNEIKNYIIQKHEEDLEDEEYEDDSASSLKESAVADGLEGIVNSFTDSKVDCVEKQFEDEEEVEANVKIEKVALENVLKKYTDKISQEFEQFLNEIKEEQSQGMIEINEGDEIECIVEYIGRYSRFKILEEPLTEIAKQFNHTVRYTSNRETIMAVGSTIISRMKKEEHFDISYITNKDQFDKIENQKIYMFAFDMYLKEKEIIFKNITTGEESQHVYYNVLKDRYECKLSLEELNDDANEFEIIIKDHSMIKTGFILNKESMMNTINKNNDTNEDAKLSIMLYAYLNQNKSERRVEVKYQKQFAPNVMVYETIELNTHEITPWELLDVEFEEKWKEQEEVLKQLEKTRDDYELYKREMNLMKSNVMTIARKNKSFEPLKKKVTDSVKKRLFNKEEYEKLKNEWDSLQNEEK